MVDQKNNLNGLEIEWRQKTAGACAINRWKSREQERGRGKGRKREAWREVKGGGGY